jgi:hypothetical protein
VTRENEHLFQEIMTETHQRTRGASSGAWLVSTFQKKICLHIEEDVEADVSSKIHAFNNGI